MSDYTAIRAVTITLQALLKEHITNSSEPQLNGVQIDLRSPKEMKDANNTSGISLWLYRVIKDASLLNQPPPRPRLNLESRHPLPVDLYYLVTPIVDDIETRHVLLGRVLQVLNDHSMLSGAELQDTLAGTSDELRVTLETTPMEELTRIWSALIDDLQLCVSYRVQLVTLESDHEPVLGPPVLVKQTTYSQIVS